MEDNFQIIIYVLVGVAYLASIIIKARKNAREAGKTPASSQEWEWDTEPEALPRPIAAEMRPAAQSAMEYKPVNSPDLKEETDAHRGIAEIIRAEGGRTTVVQNLETLPQKHHNHKDGGNIPHLSGLQEEFDLRKAVIYSEILKPKYNEY